MDLGLKLHFGIARAGSYNSNCYGHHSIYKKCTILAHECTGGLYVESWRVSDDIVRLIKFSTEMFAVVCCLV